MATRKTGPVKPPTLDLEASKKARTSAAQKPNTRSTNKSSTVKSDTVQQPTSKPATGQSMNWSLPITVLGSGLVGALLAYLIAVIGFWPNQAAQQQLVQQQLAQNNNSNTLISDLAGRLDVLEAVARANAETSTALQTALADSQTKTDGQIATIAQSLEQVQPAQAIQQEIQQDIQEFQQSLRTDIDALSNRIDAIAAGADQNTATQIADTLSATNQALDASQQSFLALETTTRDQLAALTARIEQAETGLVAQAEAESATSQTMRLPLALSGLEAALDRGRPFSAELDALSANLAAITISTALLSAAETGLPTPQSIVDDFTATIPQMLSVIPQDPAASWQDTLINQAKSLLALRPTGIVSGNSPEALIARTEAALAIPDFATASQILNAMPAPMRDAAGDLPATISSQAEARQLLVSLRASALAGDTNQ